MLMHTHVLLKKELLRHLRALTASEVKVYVAILILANPRTGRLTISLKDLASWVELSYRITNHAVLRLREMNQIRYSSDRMLRESRIEVVGYVPLGAEAIPTEGAASLQSDQASQSEAEAPSQSDKGTEGTSQPEGEVTPESPAVEDEQKESDPSAAGEPVALAPGEKAVPSNEDAHASSIPLVVQKARLVKTIARAFSEESHIDAIRALCGRHTVADVESAFAQVQRVPEDKIRRSRLALFMHILNHHGENS